MQINMQPMLNGETDVIEIDCDLTIPDGYVSGDVKFISDARVCGKITNTAGYMALTLEAEVPYEAVCARCLDEVSGIFRVLFEKTVADKGTLQNEDNDDYLIVENGLLDIDTPLVEQIILDFPLRLLCREDCMGLCPKCGKNLNDGECSCDTREVDPRLEALRALLEPEAEQSEPDGEN